MPFSGNTYTPPTGSENAAAGQVVQSAVWNAIFVDIAAAITQLDLVVGCDSVPTHLAGALGVPTCVLVTHRFDARSLDDQQPTAWYPTMRVLRQQVPGDWSAELERVLAGVRKLACAATT